MDIVELGCRCGTLWFSTFQVQKKLNFSLKFDQFDPFSQMTQKVCQNSEPVEVSGMNRFSIGSINSFVVNMLIFIKPSLPLVKVSSEASVSSKGVPEAVFFVFVGNLSICLILMLPRETGPRGSGEKGSGVEKKLSRGGKARKRNQRRRTRGCLQEAQ